MAVLGIDSSVLFLTEGGHWDSFTRWRVNFYESFSDVYWIWHITSTTPFSPASRSLPPQAPIPVSSLKSSVHIYCKETNAEVYVLYTHK